MKLSPAQIRSIKQSPKGVLPRFLQNTPRAGAKRVGAPPARELLGPKNINRQRKGLPRIRINRIPQVA